ncbi:MAG: type II toxin-antitoxin system RelE/ParE family toxin [Candidatus Infernicultor aquiphilus]|uniref:Type II toxin-antitoxin system RelE/ParE family toxin n=1 Tax=Candidatus Infernicultor aquiphilus TaxID=1805029 RepID=A0A2M7PLF5_9BACT|nr:MAG: type II toxin-antitoxin system RelE/ParE family toxin [Candidatus Atribacteria bacterium CG_4_10_14_3_um_filter_34_13]
MKVRYHPKVKSEDIPRLDSYIAIRIENAIRKRLMVNPIKYGYYLRGSLKGYRKLRVGDWRIIYRIIDKEIRIIAIGNRKDVYKFANIRK